MEAVRLSLRVCAWVTMYGGTIIALRLAEARIADQAFHALDSFEKLSNGALIVAMLALVVSVAGTALALVIRCVELLARQAKRGKFRVHLMLWSRVVLLLALCCHLAGEVGDVQYRSAVSAWQTHDIKALVLALAFGFLLVLDALLDPMRVLPE